MTSTPPASFDGKWVIVSGASSGIGRAIALELASQGARVALVGRNEIRLRETARLAGGNSRAEVAIVDLATLDGIAEAVGAIVAKTGPVYGLCHAAGTSQTLPLSATKPARASAQMDLNFFAGLELARAFTARSAMEESGGSMLWISSVYAHAGAAGQIAYSASKGAVSAAVRAMALELAPRNVRVNSLSPGLVKTEMTADARLTDDQWERIASLHPLGVGEVADVARAAAFLLHPASRWITGSDLIIDGGYCVR